MPDFSPLRSLAPFQPGAHVLGDSWAGRLKWLLDHLLQPLPPPSSPPQSTARDPSSKPPLDSPRPWGWRRQGGQVLFVYFQALSVWGSVH